MFSKKFGQKICFMYANILIVISGCSVTEPVPSEANIAVTNATYAEKISLSNVPVDEVKDVDVINRSRKNVTRTGEIYLMRGLANVFSRGIDDYTDMLRERGYDASNFSYTQWPNIAQDITVRSKKKRVSFPIVIIGHSLGGNESSKFANYLVSNNVPVKLVVAYDPVETGYVDKGTEKVINFYIPISADNRILPNEGFDGKIQNNDVSYDSEITHTNIDKQEKFQREILNQVKKITKIKKRRPLYTADGR